VKDVHFLKITNSQEYSTADQQTEVYDYQSFFFHYMSWIDMFFVKNVLHDFSSNFTRIFFPEVTAKPRTFMSPSAIGSDIQCNTPAGLPCHLCENILAYRPRSHVIYV
jgi:hypothetical protein